MMSPGEMKLCAALLDLAADEFSNHGCNDFDSSVYLSPEEREAIMFDQLGEVYGEAKSPDYRLGDHWLMRAMADRLKESF